MRKVMSEMVWIVFPRPCKERKLASVLRKIYRTHHLVCKDTIQLVVVQADHPLQSLDLVVLVHATNKDI